MLLTQGSSLYDKNAQFILYIHRFRYLIAMQTTISVIMTMINPIEQRTFKQVTAPDLIPSITANPAYIHSVTLHPALQTGLYRKRPFEESHVELCRTIGRRHQVQHVHLYRNRTGIVPHLSVGSTLQESCPPSLSLAHPALDEVPPLGNELQLSSCLWNVCATS